ncbi:response regulator [Pararhodonellum marinum]|uniref:response regulator n=1 Tax=Pararhodonellum marinum TaxID=2755358 RepID=UPI0018900786|nr:response regulator [Pararhodonellum marinum]
MNATQLTLLLADDDQDDCLFFQEALEEIKINAKLTVVNDGKQLMDLLKSPQFVLPNALFLDMNMPRKSGIDCLKEIRKDRTFNSIPVIMYSTSFDQEVVNQLFEQGATFYIQKPAEFSSLKKVISKSIDLISVFVTPQTPLDKFVITSN